MKTFAFKDDNDGYYEVLAEDGEIPKWCLDLIPCSIQSPVNANVVPQRITNYQGKVTLDAFQLYEQVENYMSLADTPRAAKLAWATGAFERNGSLVASFASMLGLTSEQVDQMFIYGAKVE